MDVATGQEAAMIRILYGTAATALEKLGQNETVSATLIADLEAVVEGSRRELERLAAADALRDSQT